MELLGQSIGQFPEVEVTLLPVVQYLAEATVFWLRYRAMKQTYLRATEIKLLAVI